MAMERSEPALVPGWLKSSGGVTGGGSADHHSVSLSSHSGNICYLRIVYESCFSSHIFERFVFTIYQNSI